MDLIQNALNIMMLGGSNDWINAFCGMPGMMDEGILNGVLYQTRKESDEIRNRAKAFVDMGHHVEEKMRTHPSGYPFGTGPLEKIYQKHLDGHMGIDVAKKEARKSADANLLHPSYLRALSFRCVQRVYGEQSDAVLGVQTLVVEAADALFDDSQHEVRAKLAAEFVRSSAWILHGKGNAAMFHAALSVGQKGLGQACTDGERAELELVLGLLHLDPYAAHRSESWYRIGIRQWFDMGQNPIGCEIGSADGLPLPKQALTTAKRHLRSAVDLAGGALKRDAMKALIQTLEAGRAIGLQPDETELVALCDQALSLLKTWPDDEQRDYVQAVLEKSKARLSKTKKNGRTVIDLQPLQELIDRMGPNAAIDTWASTIGLMVDQAPETVLTAILAERTPFFDIASDSMKEALLRHELLAMAALDDSASPSESQSIGPSSPDLWKTVSLGLAAGSTGEEEVALERLMSVVGKYPETFKRHAQALWMLTAILEMGIGSDAYNSGNLVRAATYYMEALEIYVDIGLAGLSREILDRLHDIINVAEGNADALISIAFGLKKLDHRIDALIGMPAVDLLDRISTRLIHQLIKMETSALGLIWAMELAKGRIFRALLDTSDQIGHYEPSPTTLATLEDIESLERAMAGEDLPEPTLTDETLLGAYLTESMPSAGSDRLSQLRNLRMTFDHAVTQERLLRISGVEPSITDENTVVEKLAESMVLIDLYHSRGIGVALTYTCEGIEGFVVKDETALSTSIFQMADDTIQATLTPMAMAAERIRSAILAEPGPFPVARDAQPLLEKELRKILGHGVDRLQTWWDQGKRHLCFVPHGALHYLPIHLLLWEEKPLAEQWTISYLPNISMLNRSDAHQQNAQDLTWPGAALGLSYKNHPYLPPIENSGAEVRAVAQALAVEPIVDEKVTKSLFKEVMMRSAAIHLSCHGKLYSEAPELQHLYLADEDRRSGIMSAYEFGAMDLHHIQVITLSACQSGLGRFDQGDNLKGIQANLFHAGARAIVDTLWDVNADAAETFFPEFYRCFHRGDAILDAFRTAQIKTRAAFPQFRDWGAFRLSGCW